MSLVVVSECCKLDVIIVVHSPAAGTRGTRATSARPCVEMAYARNEILRQDKR